MISNAPTEESMMTMPVSELIDYRDECIAEVQEKLIPLKAAQAVVDGINNVIGRRYATSVTHKYTEQNKAAGTVSFTAAEGYTVKANISKAVAWDQDKLRDAMSGMTWDDVQHYFSIKIGVAEKIYDGLAPSDPLKAKLEDARTVKYGAPKITLERDLS